jgi:cell division protein FtsB
VIDSFRWGGQLFPDRPSFRSAAKSTLDVSRSALDTVRSGGLIVATSGLAFVWPRPGVTRLGATAALAVFCTSTYFAVGYTHYKRAASNERVAAQRAERANADLQDALDRLRNELAVTKARNDTLSDEGAQEIAVSEQYKADRIAQFIWALEQPRDLRLTDSQRPTWAGRLSWEPRSYFSLDQSQVKVEQLSAERDAVVGERDQLRARVSELEEKLSLLQSRRGLRPVAKAATVRAALAGQAPAAAAADASASPPTGDVPAPEHPRQVAVIFPDKNFTPPSWVPTKFSNESEPIRGNSTPRPAENRR